LVRWIEAELADGQVFFDVGANVGVFSLVAACQRPGPAVIYAFEPGCRTFASLCDNIRINECGDLITPVPLPLAARSAVRRFGYKSIEAGQSKHRMLGDDASHRHVQYVLATTLDDIIAMYGLRPPTHMKIDVDGGELDVLDGAVAALASPDLRSVVIEMDGVLEPSLVGRLAEAGLVLRARYQRKPTSAVNGIFFRQ
jgi:FkbM family methyltransferase